jgi:hypothetical protein
MWYNGSSKIVVEAALECPSTDSKKVTLTMDDTVPHRDLIDNPYTIYALLDPRNDSIRYVGMSINPELRLRAHLTDREATPQKRAWLDELIMLNTMPAILLLETNILDKREGREREKFWIQELLEAGEELLNSPPIGGRLRCRHHVEEILRFYQDFGEFPDGVSPSMRRYYKREYPKYFRRKRR